MSSSPALSTQVGGDHYKDMAIQPVEFIHANGLCYFEGCVVKYVSRHRKKGGVEDLKKARHYLDLLIEFESETTDEDSELTPKVLHLMSGVPVTIGAIATLLKVSDYQVLRTSLNQLLAMGAIETVTLSDDDRRPGFQLKGRRHEDGNGVQAQVQEAPAPPRTDPLAGDRTA